MRYKPTYADAEAATPQVRHARAGASRDYPAL